MAKAFTKWKEVTTTLNKNFANNFLQVTFNKEKYTDETLNDKPTQEDPLPDTAFKAPTSKPRGRKPALSSSSRIPCGQTGLRNIGNSCFMNSVIQTLSNNPKFKDFFIQTLLPATEEVFNCVLETLISIRELLQLKLEIKHMFDKELLNACNP